MLSNCSWREGRLTATLRQPFDIIAGTVANDRASQAGSQGSEDHSEIWLRLLDLKRPEVLQSRGLTSDSRTDDATRIDVSARELVAFGPNESEAIDNVEEALAFALAEAARAGNWDMVGQLARLLEARFARTSTR